MNVILDLVQTLEVAPLDLLIPGDGRLQKIFVGLTENPLQFYEAREADHYFEGDRYGF